MVYLLSYALGLVTALAFVLGPGLWQRWRESGEPPPLSEWTSGRRKVPDRDAGRGQPPWLDAQGRRELEGRR